MHNDPTEYFPNTQRGYNPYESTGPYYGVPPLPPPPPRKRNIGKIVTIAGVILLLLVGISTTIFVAFEAGHFSAIQPTPIPTHALKPTHIPTLTQAPTIIIETPTPTPMPTIQTAVPSADELYQAFVASNLATNPIEVDHSFWLNCCTYYPAHGSIQFTGIGGDTLIIGVFNNAEDASLVASQQQWGAQYIQVDMCLLLSYWGPVDISYYKPVMQQYCV